MTLYALRRHVSTPHKTLRHLDREQTALNHDWKWKLFRLNITGGHTAFVGGNELIKISKLSIHCVVCLYVNKTYNCIPYSVKRDLHSKTERIKIHQDYMAKRTKKIHGKSFGKKKCSPQ